MKSPALEFDHGAPGWVWCKFLLGVAVTIAPASLALTRLTITLATVIRADHAVAIAIHTIETLAQPILVAGQEFFPGHGLVFIRITCSHASLPVAPGPIALGPTFVRSIPPGQDCRGGKADGYGYRSNN